MSGHSGDGLPGASDMTALTRDTTRESAAVRAVAQHAVRLVNEFVAGVRPADQVTPLFMVHLRGLVHRTRPDPGAVARIRRLAICSQRDGFYEVVAVCADAERVTAVGLQLTRATDGRWQISDVAHPHFAVGPSRSCTTRRSATAWDTAQRC